MSRLPVHPRSAALVAAMGAGAGIHADFGSGTWEGGPIGIPYTVVAAGQPRVPVRFGYAGERDPGPSPIPPDAPVEGRPGADGDRHVLVVQAGSCRLYELFDAHREGAGWRAGSGAVGLRLRLRAGVDLRGFPAQARVILQAMRSHGLVVADNGSSGFIGGVPDQRWDNDALHQLGRVTLADFEAVDTTPLRVSPASAASRVGVAATPTRPPRRPTIPRAAPAPARPVPGQRSLAAEPRVVSAAGLVVPEADAPARPAATSSGDGSGGPSGTAVLGLSLALAGFAARSRSRLHRSSGRHARPTPRGR